MLLLQFVVRQPVPEGIELVNAAREAEFMQDIIYSNYVIPDEALYEYFSVVFESDSYSYLLFLVLKGHNLALFDVPVVDHREIEALLGHRMQNIGADYQLPVAQQNVYFLPVAVIHERALINP